MFALGSIGFNWDFFPNIMSQQFSSHEAWAALWIGQEKKKCVMDVQDQLIKVNKMQIHLHRDSECRVLALFDCVLNCA